MLKSRFMLVGALVLSAWSLGGCAGETMGELEPASDRVDEGTPNVTGDLQQGETEPTAMSTISGAAMSAQDGCFIIFGHYICCNPGETCTWGPIIVVQR
ncbi:MAG TPA: hypothetical protein VM925_30495 [Labilithrix sp.]|nr:hypothetical protein [Labilithrix sp.]